MLQYTVYSLDDPGTFDLTKGDPMYWTERLSFETTKMLYDMAALGFKFRQAEDSDYVSIEGTLTTYITTFYNWADAAVDASNSGDPIPVSPALPTLPNFMSGELIALLLKVIIRVIMRWVEKKLESGTEASEIAQVLKQGLIGEVGATEYSFIELLQNTPLDIRVSLKGEHEDITYTSD